MRYSAYDLQLLRPALVSLLAVIIFVILLHPGRFAEPYDWTGVEELTTELQHPRLDLSALLASLLAVQSAYPWTQVVEPGQGVWPQGGVVLLVPYRDRAHHLWIFIEFFKIFFQNQKVNVSTYVIEQAGQAPFNRGKLFNIGYLVSQELSRPSCLLLHDVDLIPMHSAIPYSCYTYPTHMSTSIDEFRYLLPYKEMVGGVLAIAPQQFRAANGFSNQFYGWGGEDDDFYSRLCSVGLKPRQLPSRLAQYRALKHMKQAPGSDLHLRLQQVAGQHKEDGLNSLFYRNLSIRQLADFTHVLVDLD